MRESQPESPTGPPPGRRLTFAAGGWVIALAGFFTGLVVIWWAGQLIRRAGDESAPVIGDGRNSGSYRFDLTDALISADEIVAAGMTRGALEALNDPESIAGASMAELNKELARTEHRKAVTAGDRVIGVEVDGTARAYPIAVLNFHEIINDTLAGQPICVTYSGLCDSAVVFERLVAGETPNFAVSGLLYNSNLLLYDERARPEDSSLFSQLRCDAVAGPLKGQELQVLPAAVCQWQDWLSLHPETTVVLGKPELGKRYQDDIYGTYFQSGKLQFPVSPRADMAQLAGFGVTEKTRCLIVLTASGPRHASFPELRGLSSHSLGSGQPATLEVDGVTCRLNYRPSQGVTPETAWLTAPAGVAGPATLQCFFFAWYATHPDDLTPLLP